MYIVKQRISIFNVKLPLIANEFYVRLPAQWNSLAMSLDDLYACMQCVSTDRKTDSKRCRHIYLYSQYNAHHIMHTLYN